MKGDKEGGKETREKSDDKKVVEIKKTNRKAQEWEWLSLYLIYGTKLRKSTQSQKAPRKV